MPAFCILERVLPLLLLLAQAPVIDSLDPLQTPGAHATVLIFVRTDCPISNRYAPEIQRIAARFSSQGVKFWLVYADPSETADSIRKHLADYHYDLGVLRDPKRLLVKAAKARVTPEAAIFLPNRKLAYHGRIDDRYIDFGKARNAPTTHDLEAALEAVIAGKPVPSEATRAVGCYLADLQ